MVQRHCPICNADVEDVGGFCLLGHSLKVAAAMPSLDDLRAEVDQAFQDVRDEVAQVLSGTVDSSPPPPAPPMVPVAPPHVEHPAMAPAANGSHGITLALNASVPEAASAEIRPELTLVAPAREVDEPVAPLAPAPVLAPEAQRRTRHDVWETLSNEVDKPLGEGDPITAFAPAPRMDWGPERSSRLRRRT